jgi:hypothetical protein
LAGAERRPFSRFASPQSRRPAMPRPKKRPRRRPASSASAIVDLLSSETSQHIVTQDGKTELKKQIAERASKIIEPIEVADVLFSDFVVQY